MIRSEDGEGVLLRVNELRKTRGAAWIDLKLPFERAWSCNMLECPEGELEVADGRITSPVRPFEIKTILVK